MWAFGCMLLEIITRDTPYSECKTHGQVFKKLMDKKQPDALESILDLDVKELISSCLSPVEIRPTVKQLLASSFFYNLDSVVNDRPVPIKSQFEEDKTLEEDLSDEDKLIIKVNDEEAHTPEGGKSPDLRALKRQQAQRL